MYFSSDLPLAGEPLFEDLQISDGGVEIATPVLDDASSCPADEVSREGLATALIQAAIGPVLCRRNFHRGRFFSIRFPNGGIGIYKGSDSQCPGSHIVFEVQSPGC